MLATEVYPEGGREMAIMRLRAFAHAHEWWEVAGPEGEYRFVRGDTTLGPGVPRVFALPALMTAKFKPERVTMSVTQTIWDPDGKYRRWLISYGEMNALHDYIGANKQPSSSIRAKAQQGKIDWILVLMIFCFLAPLAVIPQFHKIFPFGEIFLVVTLILICLLFVQRRLNRYEKLYLQPEAYRAGMLPSMEPPPAWAAAEFDMVDERIERARRIQTLTVVPISSPNGE